MDLTSTNNSTLTIEINQNNDIFSYDGKKIDKKIEIFIIKLNPHIYIKIICKESDIFKNIINEIYNKYPSYKNENECFLANGKNIDLNSTLKENNIKDKDRILISDI